MKIFTPLVVLFIIFSDNSSGKPSRPRQLLSNLNLIPAFQLLPGANLNNNQNYLNNNPNQNTNTNFNNINNNNNNNNNNILGGGNNFFRQATVTRTIIRTVSTVTQVAFRTCTSADPALMSCVGRRRRDASEDNMIEDASASHDIPNHEPSMLVIIGTTTISDQQQVSSMLDLSPASEELIGTTQNVNSIRADELYDPTTTLYPSDEPAGVVYQDEVSVSPDPEVKPTEHETPELSDDATTSDPLLQEDEPEIARINFGGTTTITTTVGVTSVATTYATGTTLATLTVLYTGCLPPTLPVTGTACQAAAG